MMILSCYILIISLISSINANCDQLTFCESCAGADNICRWCITTKTCVDSKYLCHPWQTVIHEINCPTSIPLTYSHNFHINYITRYIHAANRVSLYSPPGAPMSCLSLIGDNFEVLTELIVPMTLGGNSIGILIGANHDLRHIFIGVRSTDAPNQFFTQYFGWMAGWMIDFPLGGKMVAFNVVAYEEVLKSGFDNFLGAAVAKFPEYTILFTGHSLGGAMTTVLSLHVATKYPKKKVVLHTWSAPRSGDETFSKLLRERLHEGYRVVRDGDFVPDMPFRISETLSTPHHNTFEVFYQSDMNDGGYMICDQPESDNCLKGSWWKNPMAHLFIFDRNYFNYHADNCTSDM